MTAQDDQQTLAHPVFNADQLAAMASFGEQCAVEPGHVLFAAGDSTQDLFIVLDGAAEAVRSDGDTDVVVVEFGPGEIVGELTLLTGQRRYLTARCTRAGRVLVISQEQFRRLMSLQPELAEPIFNALLARREMLRTGDGAQAIRIIGSRYSPEALSLRAFAERSRLPHAWIEIDDADDSKALLDAAGLSEQDIPAVITPTEVLRRPSAAVFAEHLGLTFTPTPGYIFDLVVVGSGPAGLAAAVYGASEGLRTVSLDAVAIGGQAGTSSRIENYAGFPNGISGGDLTARAAVQAMRLGARLNAPCEVSALRTDTGFHVVTLRDGSEIPTRTVIVASGAHYQRLAVENLDRFEGSGVYYAATDLEARACQGTPVLVVGGGNSAGQAAIYLAEHSCAVTIAIRGSDLTHSMSRYLIERIDANPRIDVNAGTEVDALDGANHLEQVTLREKTTGQTRPISCSALFCFIGARPDTAWLGADVLRDEHGFVLTDRQLSGSAGEAGPLPFETSVPGIFAAGDVRAGSMKRVAAAVGEGSSAVRSVHERLASGL